VGYDSTNTRQLLAGQDVSAIAGARLQTPSTLLRKLQNLNLKNINA
jgi:hypothetical protein